MHRQIFVSFITFAFRAGAGNLYKFDEIFLSSTSRDVTPVISIDGKMVGLGKPGPITREIQAKFHTAPDQIEI